MTMFWVVCGLIGRYQRFRAEDGDSMFLGNVDIDPRNYTALEPNATISVLVVDVAMCARLCKCRSARRVFILDLT